MNLLWEYKSERYQESDLGYFILHDNLIELYSVDHTGTCSSHVIGRQIEVPQHYKEVIFEEKVWFMPLEFVDVKLVGLEANTRSLVDEGIYIAYESENGDAVHLIQPIYQKAVRMTKKHKNLVYVWYHGKTLILLIFKEGQLHLGNVFDVDGHVDAVYYITAAMQDAKFDVQSHYLVCDADEKDAQVLGNDFEKLGIHMDIFYNEKPYQKSSEFPNMVFASSLMYIFSCALPEAY